jgi:hypothetical protein
MAVPPHDPAYQYQLAPVPSDPPESVRVTVVPLQMLLLLALMEEGAVDSVFTVTVTD